MDCSSHGMRSALLGCMVAFTVFARPVPAAALGAGPSIGYGYAGGTVTEVDDSDEVGTATHGLDVGLMMDTNAARDRLFSYRVTTAFEFRQASWWTEYYDRQYQRPLQDVTVPSFGLALEQTFGFGLLRNPSVRMILGPSLRLAVLSGSAAPDGVTGSEAQSISILQLDGGLGPLLGVNIHIGDQVSLAVSVAYYAQIHYGALDDPYRPYDDGQTSYGYLGFTSRAGLTAAVLFRSVGDAYRR